MASPERSLLLAFFITPVIHLTCACQCGHCVSATTNQVIENRGFDKHIIKTLTVQNFQECGVRCNKECSCQSFQLYAGSKCDLLHEDRQTAPQDFKRVEGCSYYDFSKKYVNQNPHATCPSTPCENSCCKSQPCQNNGLCKELCESARQKFNCTCPVDYKGKYCEVFKAKSCKELITKYPGIKSGTYDIHDSNDKSFPTFCDFTSEAGMAWTLVESFALKNNKQFKKPFFTDNPINENILQWDAFRLSMSHMKQLIGVSTHFRATCNFPTDGLSYTDYVRAKLSIVDLMNSVNSCFTLEFLNIRGHSCANCDSVFAHRSSYHPHLDSYHGATKCAFKEQGIGTVVSEDNFGYYGSANPVHRCTSSQSATTQWWIGGKI